MRSALRTRAAAVADALLHGRGCIALVAVLLVGIVFFNVDLLQMNRDIAQTASRAAAVKRENAQLKLRVARLASTERVQNTAQQHGLVLPQPGQVHYLRADRAVDGRRAARQLADWANPAAPVVTPTPTAAPVAQQAPVQPAQQPVAAQPTPATPTPQPQAQPQTQQQAQSQATPPVAGPTGAPAAPQG